MHLHYITLCFRTMYRIDEKSNNSSYLYFSVGQLAYFCVEALSSFGILYSSDVAVISWQQVIYLGGQHMFNSKAVRITFALLLIAFGLLVPVFAQEPTAIPTTAGTVNLEEAAEDAVDVTNRAAEATIDSASALIQRLTQQPKSEIVRVLFVIGGAILLVAGWRIYEFVVLIAGFLVGAAFGLAVAPDSSTFVQVAAFIIGGLIGAALSVFVYYVAVFLIGAYVGIALTDGIARSLGLLPISPVALFIGAIIGGVILLGLSIELLLVISALVGAQLIVMGLGLRTEWVLILTVAGIIIQLIAARAWQVPIRRELRRGWYRFRRSP